MKYFTRYIPNIKYCKHPDDFDLRVAVAVVYNHKSEGPATSACYQMFWPMNPWNENES